MAKQEGGINCSQTTFAEEKITTCCEVLVREIPWLWLSTVVLRTTVVLATASLVAVSQGEMLPELWEEENILPTDRTSWPYPFQMPLLLLSAMPCNGQPYSEPAALKTAMCPKPFQLWVCFSPLLCSSQFLTPPSLPVRPPLQTNVFPFHFMRQTEGIFIPSPKPGEEKFTSAGQSQLEELC